MSDLSYPQIYKIFSTIIFKIPVSLAEKIKLRVDVNEDDFVSEIQALRHGCDFYCNFHELLMNIIKSDITIISSWY